MASEKGADKNAIVADMGKDISVDSLKTAATMFLPIVLPQSSMRKPKKLSDHKAFKLISNGSYPATIFCGAGCGIRFRLF